MLLLCAGPGASRRHPRALQYDGAPSPQMGYSYGMNPYMQQYAAAAQYYPAQQAGGYPCGGTVHYGGFPPGVPPPAPVPAQYGAPSDPAAAAAQPPAASGAGAEAVSSSGGGGPPASAAALASSASAESSGDVSLTLSRNSSATSAGGSAANTAAPHLPQPPVVQQAARAAAAAASGAIPGELAVAPLVHASSVGPPPPASPAPPTSPVQAGQLPGRSGSRQCATSKAPAEASRTASDVQPLKLNSR